MTRYVRAMASHSSSTEGQLCFGKGAVLTELESDSEAHPGWAFGRLGQSEGWYPASSTRAVGENSTAPHVRRRSTMSPGDVAAALAAGDARAPPPTAEAPTAEALRRVQSLPQMQPRLVAVASYESQHAGELSVRVGRSLDVIQVAKGWVAVVDDAGGAGWVPDAVVGGQAEVLARLGGAKLPRTLRPKSRGSPVGSPVRAARALDRLGHVSPQINRRSASTTNLPRINDDEAAAQHVVEGAKFEIESAKHVQSNYDSEDDLDAASHELLDRGDRDARDALLARNELEAMQHENAALRKRVEELEACTLTPRRRLREVASNTTADVVAMKKERDECRDQLDCALCMERPRSVAFFPCTHLCACAECAAQCSECPQCRRAVQSKLQVIIS
ncbi:hypothetical protein M885DRAFT_516413 [Pelagophyceae sp. CCMP2097]|nr:hypothetical protein M885DRAFT_516413 [Pelagophyceae sp. CCMP2097]